MTASTIEVSLLCLMPYDRNSIRRFRGLCWRGLVVFILLVSVYMLVDGIVFFRSFLNYAEMSQADKLSIPWKAADSEAIVVLTGDRGRIPEAVELLRLRGSQLLLISGTGKGVSKKALVNQQGDAATQIHKTWEKIILESKSGSTIENAQQTGKILESKLVRHVVLVTSDYHMPRSMRVFNVVYPSVDYWAYPVESDVAEFSELNGHQKFNATWKLAAEYWKYFVFRHVRNFLLE